MVTIAREFTPWDSLLEQAYGPADSPEKGYWLSGLAVLPEVRRYGIGRRLVSIAESLAKEEGATWVRLETNVNTWNELNPWYQSMGYDQRLQTQYSTFFAKRV